jgi:2-aminoadipate transaminase
MDLLPELVHDSKIPLYRQLFDQLANQIRVGQIAQGTRLPATRELAGLLGLNRTTVSAAYDLLASAGLVSGQVGRGSYVTTRETARGRVNWSELLDAPEPVSHAPAGLGSVPISFVMSRPSRDLFPLDEFRASAEAVLRRSDLADILQLGSPSGYEPLRRRLLEEARAQQLAGPGDDVLVTNGCQQALDLVGRVLLRPGDSVAVEDPVYTGLKNLLAGMGARLVGIPFTEHGLDVSSLARTLERERPRLLVVTPNFQNPTGVTLSTEQRRELLAAAQSAGVPVIENDPYGELRYQGERVPAIKEMDQHGGTVLLRSFSKISFPGLRVGWVVGPKPLLDRLRHAKEASDLHTDQLSQAVLLEFAESGRLEAHRSRVLRAGAERLAATLEACGNFLPAGTRWTRPEGGMNIWVRLPEPLDAAGLLPSARKQGVAYLPGRYFAVSHVDPGALRLSFAGLAPDEIREGLRLLGKVFSGEAERLLDSSEPVPAMV